MKKLILFLFVSHLSVFQLSAQKISLQLSSGLSVSSAGLIHPTNNGTDFTVQDALASTAPGIFGDGELQMYFKKIGVGIMYSVNLTKLNEKDFKENRSATLTRSEWINFQSIMLQILLRKNITEKVSMQFSLAGGKAFLNESTHQMDYPHSLNNYSVRHVNIQTASGGKANLTAQINHSVSSNLDLFLKCAFEVIWMSTEVDFSYRTVNSPETSATFDLLPFFNNIGIGLRGHF